VLNDTLIAFAYAALPWMVALFFYLEAGRRSWQNMWLMTPERSKEPLAMAVRSNTVPWYVLAIWAIFWGPILLIAWLSGRVFRVGQGQGSFLDLQ
jgi:hypothetical protein